MLKFERQSQPGGQPRAVGNPARWGLGHTAPVKLLKKYNENGHKCTPIFIIPGVVRLLFVYIHVAACTCTQKVAGGWIILGWRSHRLDKPHFLFLNFVNPMYTMYMYLVLPSENPSGK